MKFAWILQEMLDFVTLISFIMLLWDLNGHFQVTSDCVLYIISCVVVKFAWVLQEMLDFVTLISFSRSL